MPATQTGVSPARSAAARANGAKSRGPKTSEGKARSCRNALKHGMRAEILLLPDDDPEEIEAIYASYCARLLPRDEHQREVVRRMAAAQWHTERAIRIEARLLTAEILRQSEKSTNEPKTFGNARAFAAQSSALAQIGRYESRHHRQYDKALKEMQNCTNEPKPINAPNRSLTTDHRPLTTSATIAPAAAKH